MTRAGQPVRRRWLRRRRRVLRREGRRRVPAAAEHRHDVPEVVRLRDERLADNWPDVRTDCNGFYYLGIMDYARPAQHNNLFVTRTARSRPTGTPATSTPAPARSAETRAAALRAVQRWHGVPHGERVRAPHVRRHRVAGGAAAAADAVAELPVRHRACRSGTTTRPQPSTTAPSTRTGPTPAATGPSSTTTCGPRGRRTPTPLMIGDPHTSFYEGKPPSTTSSSMSPAI